jgi:GNAT superfamily N-acetyltransferase
LSLRDAAEADGPFLQALFASVRAAEMAVLGWPQADLDALLADQFRLQHHHLVTHFAGADFWIVERPDRDGANLPVGRFYLDRSTPLWRVVDIGFLPEARGQGRGTALLAWTKDTAIAAGALGIDLHVAASNPRARSLYRRLGFQTADDTDVSHLRMAWQPA